MKLPADAFEVYYSLGSSRSYEAVAAHFRVSKRAVTKRALRDNWQGQILERDRKAQEAVQKKAQESIEEMSRRHLRICKAIQGKALETLKALPLATAMDAIRALDMTIKQERLAMGQPTERSVEEVIKREYERWLTVPDTTENHDEPEVADDHVGDAEREAPE